MILLTGEDAPLLEQVSAAFTRRDVAHRRIDADDAAAARGNLFQAAFDARADALVVVEPVARKGAEPAAADDVLLREAIAACNGPTVKALFLVTCRAEDDETLRALRRAGVPYLVLRPAPLFEVRPTGVEHALQGRTVLVHEEAAALTD
ncbi:MAG TPA: hypothetical protein VHB21_05490, partial [Minicystis sp.]|nr:hypothetical protein [Minicystis sp.]